MILRCAFPALLVWLALAPEPARTQSNPTVFQTIFTNQATATASSPVRNIGQLGHVVYLRWSANGGATCDSNDAVNVGLEASFDNTNYFRIGPIIPHVGFLGNNDVIAADGVFPYVRLNLRAISADCLLSASYAGTLFSSQTLVTSVIGPDKNYRATVAVVGPTSLAPALTGAEIVSVYELVLFNPNAANTVTIGSTSGGSCTVGSGIAGIGFVVTNLCQNCGLVLPYTGKSHFSTFERVGATGGDLCLLLGAATGVDVTVRYRYE